MRDSRNGARLRRRLRPGVFGYGITCVSVTRCYAVGAGGTILARQ